MLRENSGYQELGNHKVCGIPAFSRCGNMKPKVESVINGSHRPRCRQPDSITIMWILFIQRAHPLLYSICANMEKNNGCYRKRVTTDWPSFRLNLFMQTSGHSVNLPPYYWLLPYSQSTHALGGMQLCPESWLQSKSDITCYSFQSPYPHHRLSIAFRGSSVDWMLPGSQNRNRVSIEETLFGKFWSSCPSCQARG